MTFNLRPVCDKTDMRLSLGFPWSLLGRRGFNSSLTMLDDLSYKFVFIYPSQIGYPKFYS